MIVLTFCDLLRTKYYVSDRLILVSFDLFERALFSYDTKEKQVIFYFILFLRFVKLVGFIWESIVYGGDTGFGKRGP